MGIGSFSSSHISEMVKAKIKLLEYFRQDFLKQNSMEQKQHRNKLNIRGLHEAVSLNWERRFIELLHTIYVQF